MSASPWPFKRVYHGYTKLEEFTCGMWRIVNGPERVALRESAAMLMRDAPAFKAAMLRAVHGWRYSCEHNLTARSVNRIAWLGHAGCCLATTAPEDVTRDAWWTLNQVQQGEANRVAAEALAAWETLYHARLNGGDDDQDGEEGQRAHENLLRAGVPARDPGR